MPSVISKAIFSFALISLSAWASAFGEPLSCELADQAKATLIEEMRNAQPPIGVELYTTNQNYQQMKRALNQCQDDAFRACYPNLKKSIALSELKTIFKEWRHHRYYKLADPSGLCLNRAYLLAREMTERGYFVEVLQIDPAPSITSITRNDDGQPTNYTYYEKHWAVQITAVDESGSSRVYLLDPQFALTPVLRNDYFTELTGEVCVEGPTTNAADCSFHIFPATHQLYPVADTKPALSESCGWSRTNDYRLEIETALTKMPAAFLPLPISYQNLRTSLLRSGWQRHVDILKWQIANLKENESEKAEKLKIDLKNVEERRRQIGF